MQVRRLQRDQTIPRRMCAGTYNSSGEAERDADRLFNEGATL